MRTEMNGVKLEKPCASDIDPEVAISGIVRVFEAIGYTLVTKLGPRVELKSAPNDIVLPPEQTSSSTSSGVPRDNPRLTAPGKHRVIITVTPGVVQFEFTTGVVASSWSETERAAADEFAQRAVDAVTTQEHGPYRG